MDSEPLTLQSLLSVREWFRTEARAYPWSVTDDPYAVWISEVMLQQTVVTAAVAPFTIWMNRWPDLASLAAAAEDQVLRAWEGLGYASRAKNLHRAAKFLVDQGRRTLPDTEPELRSLPGVGEYTASAILSFAFHRPALTLDANLKRVFQRLDGAPVWTPEVETRWRTVWAALVDGLSSRESNQAVMQLGQRVCRAKSPLCQRCPLAGTCRALHEGTTSVVPEPKTRTVIEKATVVVFWYRDQSARTWWLAKPKAGRFSNLWLAPPCNPPAGASKLTGRIHTYTKYHDKLTPFMALWNFDGDPPVPEDWTGRWVTVSEARLLGMVSTYRKILDEAQEIRVE